MQFVMHPRKVLGLKNPADLVPFEQGSPSEQKIVVLFSYKKILITTRYFFAALHSRGRLLSREEPFFYI